MAWYWIVLIVLSVAVGPFEAMYAFNKARRQKEDRDRRRKERRTRRNTAPWDWIRRLR